MINREHDLPIKRQAELLGINRGSVYYLPRPVSDADLALMRIIDALHLDHPFMSARMLLRMLWREGLAVGRRHVATSPCFMTSNAQSTAALGLRCHTATAIECTPPTGAISAFAQVLPWVILGLSCLPASKALTRFPNGCWFTRSPWPRQRSCSPPLPAVPPIHEGSSCLPAFLDSALHLARRSSLGACTVSWKTQFRRRFIFQR